MRRCLRLVPIRKRIPFVAGSMSGSISVHTNHETLDACDDGRAMKSMEIGEMKGISLVVNGKSSGLASRGSKQQ